MSLLHPPRRAFAVIAGPRGLTIRITNLIADNLDFDVIRAESSEDLTEALNSMEMRRAALTYHQNMMKATEQSVVGVENSPTVL